MFLLLSISLDMISCSLAIIEHTFSSDKGGEEWTTTSVSDLQRVWQCSMGLEVDLR